MLMEKIPKSYLNLELLSFDTIPSDSKEKPYPLNSIRVIQTPSRVSTGRFVCHP